MSRQWVTLDGVTYELAGEGQWDGDTFVLPLAAGGTLRLARPYPVDIKIIGLDYGEGESATISCDRRHD